MRFRMACFYSHYLSVCLSACLQTAKCESVRDQLAIMLEKLQKRESSVVRSLVDESEKNCSVDVVPGQCSPHSTPSVPDSSVV